MKIQTFSVTAVNKLLANLASSYTISKIWEEIIILYDIIHYIEKGFEDQKRDD